MIGNNPERVVLDTKKQRAIIKNLFMWFSPDETKANIGKYQRQ